MTETEFNIEQAAAIISLIIYFFIAIAVIAIGIKTGVIMYDYLDALLKPYLT